MFKMICMETKPFVDVIVGHNTQRSEKECYIPSFHHFRAALNNLKKSCNIFYNGKNGYFSSRGRYTENMYSIGNETCNCSTYVKLNCETKE
jgi:hypothetical protein